MTFEKLFESYAPTAPESLDDCALAAYQAGAASRDAEVELANYLFAKQLVERDQLREQMEMLRSHMTTFVRRCDLGEIRSNKTYAAFVKALADTEPKK